MVVLDVARVFFEVEAAGAPEGVWQKVCVGPDDSEA